MRLIRYRVWNFRSVSDSDWIEVDAVTALIGVNESGKTNLLVPLWKFNPALEGELQPTADYPKKLFGLIREAPGLHRFITTEFECTDEFSGQLATLTGLNKDQCRLVQVSRFYDGKYTIAFPGFTPKEELPGSALRTLVESATREIDGITPLRQEEATKVAVLAAAGEILAACAPDAPIGAGVFDASAEKLTKALPENAPKTGAIAPRTLQLVEELHRLSAELSAAPPESTVGVKDAIVEAVPTFVYYSNYGNLDSEIYLPHVVQNLTRTDLGSKESAKARTLRVLFNFVRLQPAEILDLGRDFKDPNNRQPNAAEIEAIGEKKRERAILLQSAGSLLTEKFRSWWKQGDYRFRFDADGNHFRIWVSDDRRPEEVELESRSTGLQWFLSFYLVFLVESAGAHRNAVLLLDEPGLSLHPLAQRDLSRFFDGLATTNQIVYTTHSPFLVDADRLDRVRKVYVSEDGTTKASPNLRQAGADPAHAGAAYAVYSALNLSLAESLLLGCQPVVVEGASDQHYLTMIKTLLISGGKISPARELVFPPSGGTKTLRITASILTGRDDRLPAVLLDSDEAGKKMARELGTSLYATELSKVLAAEDYAGFASAEIEDLLPPALVAEATDRYLRAAEQPFNDVLVVGKPIVPQIEAWAASQGLKLELGWKVEIAKRVKQLGLQRGLAAVDGTLQDAWVRLFTAFASAD